MNVPQTRFQIDDIFCTENQHSAPKIHMVGKKDCQQSSGLANKNENEYEHFKKTKNAKLQTHFEPKVLESNIMWQTNLRKTKAKLEKKCLIPRVKRANV